MIDIDTLLSYIMELLEFVKPVGGLVSDWFTGMYANIPTFEKIFNIATGLCMLSVVIYLFYRLLSD